MGSEIEPLPELKLWYTPGACSLAPHVLLHEVGQPHQAILVSLADGAHLTDAFARLNPKRRVPVLSLDGTVITEVPAIMVAIADLAADGGLLGSSPLPRARVHEWLAWLAGTVHGQGFGPFWRPERFSARPEHHDGIRAKGRATIATAFDVIEGKLGGLHAVGDAFTAVDPYLLVFYRWGNGVGFPMADSYPLYAALARRLVERPAVRAALAAEGIDPLRDRVPVQGAL